MRSRSPVGPPDKCYAHLWANLEGLRLQGVTVWGYSCEDASGTLYISEEPEYVYVRRYTMGPDPCWTEEETTSIRSGVSDWSTAAPLLRGDDADCYHSSDDPVCNNDPSSCTGDYTVKVGVLPENLDASSRQCREYYPHFLTIHGVSEFAAAETTAAADCTAGSGRFTLAPHTSRDGNRDGRFAVTFVPVMLNGTGTMTRGATVTSITPVTPWPVGSTQRVVTTRGSFGIADDDTLHDGATVSQVITAPATFAPGALVGNPIFFGEGLEEPFGPYDVDIAWTCPTGRPVVARPPGWQIPLSTMGCPLQQKMTLRYDSARQRVVIEPYGTPALSATVPTTTTPTGQRFVWERPGLRVDATLVSTTQQQATVRLDSVTTPTGPVCTPGTYTLVAE